MQNPNSQLNYFGKVKGKQKDYFVVYGLINKSQKETPNLKINRLKSKPKGFGINNYVVLVAVSSELNKGKIA